MCVHTIRAYFKQTKNKFKFDGREYNYVVVAHELRANSIILEHKVVGLEEILPLQPVLDSDTPTYVRM